MDKLLAPVYVFDLDGVITDAQTSLVNEVVVGTMYQMMKSGTYVMVNTGRSYEWVESVLVERYKAYNNAEIFSRFIAICEKGGEMVTWQHGEALIEPSEFALQTDVYDLTKKFFEENQTVFQSMFWDTTKRTMATIEKLPTADLEQFHVEQRTLVEKLSEVLSNYEVRIDPTMIATDVESLAAGKFAGAELIYRWIHGIDPSLTKAFISIGDSISDYEMARCFADHGAKSTFVYVGKPTDKIKHHKDVDFVSTTSLYASGTFEFLKSQ